MLAPSSNWTRDKKLLGRVRPPTSVRVEDCTFICSAEPEGAGDSWKAPAEMGP